jgi:hypothetical protein
MEKCKYKIRRVVYPWAELLHKRYRRYSDKSKKINGINRLHGSRLCHPDFSQKGCVESTLQEVIRHTWGATQ